MSARRSSASKRRPRKLAGASDGHVVYIHGIGEQPAKQALELQWDLALFGRELGARTRMAYWADILHPAARKQRLAAAGGAGAFDADALLEAIGLDPEDEKVAELRDGLLRTLGLRARPGVGKRVIPLPGFLRRPLARRFLEAFVGDSAAYFFEPELRRRIRARLEEALPRGGEPCTVVAHSLGSVIAFEVLSRANIQVVQFVTLGSPLGIREIQDLLDPGTLRVPPCAARWSNFADPFDPVALDKGLSGDFTPEGRIVDRIVLNTQTRSVEDFNPHAAAGYLAHPEVRRAVHTAIRYDSHSRFLIARDVAEGMAAEARRPVLIEVLEPGYAALGESEQEVADHERQKEKDGVTLPRRIERAARSLEAIVGQKNADDARIDRLRRFVSARLTPSELCEVAGRHRELRVYAIWKSAAKRKLIARSRQVVQADAALETYKASGDGVTWAILDTGVRRDHPHFRSHDNILAVWDCTRPGPPRRSDRDKDPDGHGTHVAGIIAGQNPDPKQLELRGVAPRTTLVVYKVLNDAGEGEDAWIIKALDHIAEQNESSASLAIHGINLSLGGPYDGTVYGCGFSPICAELRRQWRSGVLVCVACGNEGQLEVSTPDGNVDLNTPMSIGDPANLEDCIAVGSVNADKPHLYGVSSFSSRGPTSDGRVKPDVVAPGERISSCNSHYRGASQLYRYESGTSMAVPHVSGLLAAFLSVRREFRGRPDEVKRLLLRTCTDLGRDRYHQGHGLPNLMKMLLEA